MKVRIGIAALALLGGCDRAAPEPPARHDGAFREGNREIVVPAAALETGNAAATTGAPPLVGLAGDGLVLKTRRAAFGMPRATATALIAGSLGEPIEVGDQQCGAGALGIASFPGGLTLYFQGGKFAGWDLDGRERSQLATPDGIGIGSTRGELETRGPVTVADSSIGIEFQLGGLSGLLDSRTASGRVTNLWAGVTCIAR